VQVAFMKADAVFHANANRGSPLGLPQKEYSKGGNPTSSSLLKRCREDCVVTRKCNPVIYASSNKEAGKIKYNLLV
jgi:hypothetical protein